MGKGTIKSGGEAGQYNVELTYNRTRLDAVIAAIDKQIETLTTEISSIETKIMVLEYEISLLPEGDAKKAKQAELQKLIAKKDLAELKKTAYEKRKEYLQNNMPEDPTVSAWCSDLTEDLSGNVGTIEVPGERGIVLIQPGYESNAVYDTERDGQLQPAVGGTPASVFYNLAMLPGWQKWKPTYRYGTISNIDTDADTCDVQLYADKSSQQGLAVNQESKLAGIPIEYMSCNAGAFEDGDSVLVKFEGQEWSGAKVIGFVDKPKACKTERVWVRMQVGLNRKCFVWDVTKNKYASINKDDGDPVSFPCNPTDIEKWYQRQELVGVELFQENCGMSDRDYPELPTCGRDLFMEPELSCSGGDQGTAGGNSDEIEELADCGCGFTNIGECSTSWTFTTECYYDPYNPLRWHWAGPSSQSATQDILWEGFSWEERGPKKLIFQNNKEGEDKVESAFRVERQYSKVENFHATDGGGCGGLSCEEDRLDSGIYSSTYKFQAPLESNLLEINYVGTQSWNMCTQMGAQADENYLLAARFNPRGTFSDKIIAQIYTIETRTVTRDANCAWSWEGCCGSGCVGNSCPWQNKVFATNGLSIVAQAGIFEGDDFLDGTTGVDPTELPRNADFENAISDMYDILREEEGIPETDMAVIGLQLTIFKG